MEPLNLPPVNAQCAANRRFHEDKKPVPDHLRRRLATDRVFTPRE
jgi:hypothetical protein